MVLIRYTFAILQRANLNDFVNLFTFLHCLMNFLPVVVSSHPHPHPRLNKPFFHLFIRFSRVAFFVFFLRKFIKIISRKKLNVAFVFEFETFVVSTTKALKTFFWDFHSLFLFHVFRSLFSFFFYCLFFFFFYPFSLHLHTHFCCFFFLSSVLSRHWFSCFGKSDILINGRYLVD